MGLRKGQKELVEEYRGGYCAVPAIPGGGKTHCLSLWAVEMISKGFNKPGKILIVTYMNTAVNNFKQRISKELAKKGILDNRGYHVSTIHGLCLQIIKEKPDLFMINEEFGIIDEVTKNSLIGKALDEWRKNNNDKFNYYINTESLSMNKLAEHQRKWRDRLSGIILSIIGDFKTRGLGLKKLDKMVKKLDDNSIIKWAFEIYTIYDRYLKSRNYLDFDDMLFNAKKLLQEDEMLLENYRNKFKFVCEDEAQDSNNIQSEILELIANGNLLRVGDSNQAICGSFSNSDFELFKDFCNDEKTTVYNITQSSRNSVEIINLANYFVKFVRKEHPVLEAKNSLLPQYIEPVDESDAMANPITEYYGINTGVFSKWEDEARRVVATAYEMMQKYPGKTISILVPSSWKISFIVSILESRLVPYEELSNISAERNKSLKVLGRVIDFISMPESSEKFAEMVLECFLVENYEEYSANDIREEFNNGKVGDSQKEKLRMFIRSTNVEDILYPTGGELDIKIVDEGLRKLKIWNDFYESLDTIRDILEFPLTVVEKLILYISEKLKFDKEERAIAQKVAGDVRYMMAQDPKWRISDLADELLKTRNAFNYFAGIVWELKGYEPQPGVISVSTYHKSKGLEWDIVFLTGLSSDDFPVEMSDRFIGEYWYLKEEYKNPKAVSKAELKMVLGEKCNESSVLEAKLETISEKARLLYVGITRAKEYLFLSAAHANKGKKNEIKPSKYFMVLREFIEKEKLKWQKI